LNIFAQCKKYGIPLWQCPQFLFVVMGLLIIVSSVSFYLIGERYIADPRIVALVVLIVSITFLIIAFIITHSFENLAEANRMKTEFVNIVSHQLRTPLTNLRWATQFLSSTEFGGTSQSQKEEYYDIIKENSARMEQLIDDLLTITRLKQDKIDRKKTKFSLNSLVKEVISEYSRFARASNLKIEFKSPPKLPSVFASYPLIKIVVENLINNAIHYSRGGKIFIELKSLPPKRVVFKIKDEGIGIPSEDQKYIFQKFFRAKNATKTEVYGTGLGLFIVKLILDSMDGKVWFVSKENQGSTFYFSLPIGSAIKQLNN